MVRQRFVDGVEGDGGDDAIAFGVGVEAVVAGGGVGAVFVEALGVGRELSPESRSWLWRPGDILFLFSSGLPWETEHFQTELLAQLAVRVPGADLSAVVALAAESGGAEAPWNQTVLAVEALA